MLRGGICDWFIYMLTVSFLPKGGAQWVFMNALGDDAELRVERNSKSRQGV